MVLESKIDQFISNIKLGVQFFKTAGELLVQLLDEDPYVFERIIKHSSEDWLTVDVLHTFEQIGRNQLAVEAIFLPKHVIDRLLELPADKQVEIATKPVSVVAGTRHGRHSVIQKSARNLSKKESARVIGPNGVRTPEEQAELLNSKPNEEHCSSCGMEMKKHMDVAEMCKKLEEARGALKVICTWAKFRNGECLTPKHTEELCLRTLKL
jgi:hypothetical protein